MRCQTCSELLPLSAKSCFECGAPVAPSVQPVVVEVMAPPATRVCVRAVATVLRDRPFASARAICTVYAGEVATALGAQAGFIQVELADGRCGYLDLAAVGGPDTTTPGATMPPAPNGTAHRGDRPAAAADDGSVDADAVSRFEGPTAAEWLASASAAAVREVRRLAGAAIAALARRLVLVTGRPSRAYAVAGVMLAAAALIGAVAARRGPHAAQSAVSSGHGATPVGAEPAIPSGTACPRWSCSRPTAPRWHPRYGSR